MERSFRGMLGVLAGEGLIDGKTVGVDASTLEANAAMRSIVRRDTGEAYNQFLTRLAKASGIETPTQTELGRLDRKRSKKGSNKEWEHPHDPDARITKMKDGRTHLAHKVEHAADMKTGAILAVTVQGADQGDTTTIKETMIQAAHQMETLAADPGSKLRNDVLSELVADKGYHSNDTLTGFKDLNIRSYISEPDRGRRNWKDKSEENSRLCQPATNPRQPGQAITPTARTDVGTTVRTHAGNRRNASGSPPTSGQHSQARPDSICRFESEPDPSEQFRKRHTTRPSGPTCHGLIHLNTALEPL